MKFGLKKKKPHHCKTELNVLFLSSAQEEYSGCSFKYRKQAYEIKCIDLSNKSRSSALHFHLSTILLIYIN